MTDRRSRLPQEGYLRPHEIERSTLSPDTDPRVEAARLEIFRRMPSWRKFELVEEAILASRQLALAGLRARHPDAGADELERRLMALLHGEELAARVWGPLEEQSDRVP